MQKNLSIIFFGLLSVMVHAGPNPKPNLKFVYHTVEKGETLYSISRQYGVRPQDVAEFNEAIGGKQIVQVGQKLKIPATMDNANDVTNASPSVSTESYHIVKSGETVFRISKMYGMAPDQLASLNKIRDNNIAVGQKLIVKNGGSAASTDKQDPPAEDKAPTTIPDDVSPFSSKLDLAATKPVKSWKDESVGEMREYNKGRSEAAEFESLYYQNIYPGMVLKAESGMAKFLAENNTSNIAYYNNAPIGTILKLTNTENGKSTYAIVVGRLAQTEESCLLKLSGKVASSLSAKDNSNIQIFCYHDN